MGSQADAFPDIVEVVVEIPRGSRNKYEYDEAAGVFRLDRVLSSAVFYKFDYGFVNLTRADDGDHTDALLLIDEPTFPETYKLLEDKTVEVLGWRERDRAREVLAADRATWGQAEVGDRA